MRLKLLTNLNTLLLIGACLALGATLWWSQQALERPYQLMARYLSLSQSFQQDVAQNIHDYLASGDALRHSAATKAIGQFAGELDSLPSDLATDLKPSLLELQDFTANDLLAAGKLAGDPQGLLLQAEREMSGALEQLSAYADSSNDGSTYRAPLFQAAQHLIRLSHARGKLVSSGRSELRSEVEHELSQLNQQAQRLNDLPLLGVSAKKSDDSTDFGALLGLDSETSSQPEEDQGIALKREFSSLLQRYPAELQRTRTLIEQRQELAGSTQAKVGALQEALAAIEPQVRAQYGEIQGQVQLLQGLMIGLILLIALTIDTIQRRLTNVLHRLVPALSAAAA